MDKATIVFYKLAEMGLNKFGQIYPDLKYQVQKPNKNGNWNVTNVSSTGTGKAKRYYTGSAENKNLGTALQKSRSNANLKSKTNPADSISTGKYKKFQDNLTIDRSGPIIGKLKTQRPNSTKLKPHG